MKSRIIATIAFILCITLVKSQKPQTVYSVAKVSMPHAWYVEQAGLWWKEIQKNQKCEEAWFNYFKACRMAKISARNPTNWKSEDWLKESSDLKEGDEIIQLADKHIPDSFTSNFIKWWNHGSDPAMFQYLKRAYEINPDSPEMYADFVTYYETQSDIGMRKKYNMQWFGLNDMSPGLLALNYNMLVTASPGSIIITGGDNDTYPAWMLQDAQGLFPTVRVINLHLLNIPEYRDKIFKQFNITPVTIPNKDGSTTENNILLLSHILKNKPAKLDIYLSMFLWKGYYAGFEDKLYIVGNLLFYSEKQLNSIALLEDNFFRKYLIDYLIIDLSHDLSKGIVDNMNRNYLPGLTKLRDYYLRNKPKEKAFELSKIKTLIDKLDFDVPKEFSPDGDGINDYWIIKDLENYPDAKVLIFDQKGKFVFKKEHFCNTRVWGEPGAWWDGTSNQPDAGDNQKLPDGVYLYLIYYNNIGESPRKGFLYLHRKNEK